MEILKIFILVTLGTVIFMFLVQVFIRWKTGKIVGKEYRAFGDNIILYFYSPSCGMCRKMEPIIESISKKFKVRKIDISDEVGFKIAKELGILGTPTTVIIKDGKIAKVFLGVQPEEKILKEVGG